VTKLRKMMLEELERRNYTQSTTRAYLRTIEDFARYFKRPLALGEMTSTSVAANPWIYRVVIAGHIRA
jgi:hypothetical protein